MTSRTWLLVTLGLYLVLGTGYGLMIPVWEAPDEPAHYNLILYITRARRLPPPDLPNYEINQPPLYYLLASGPLSLVDRLSPGAVDYHQPYAFVENIQTRKPVFNWNEWNYRPLWGARALRAFSLILGLFTLILNHLAFCDLLPQKPALVASATLLAGLTPQFLHLSSSINNDNLANLAGAALLFLMIRLSTRRWRPGLALLAAILALLAPVTVKLTLLPVSLATLLVVLRAGRVRVRATIPRFVWIAGLTTLALLILIAVLSLPGLKESLISQLTWRLFSLNPKAGSELAPWNTALNFTMTYWGKVGWVAVGFPLFVNQVLLFLSALGLVGSLSLAFTGWLRMHAKRRAAAFGLALYPILILNLIKFQGWRTLLPLAFLAAPWVAALFHWIRVSSSGHEVDQPGRMAWQTVWAVVLLTGLALTRNSLTSLQMQGRFAFPAIGAVSALIAGGWYMLTPARLRPRLPVAIALVLLAGNLYLWWDGVIPIYYQPWF